MRDGLLLYRKAPGVELRADYIVRLLICQGEGSMKRKRWATGHASMDAKGENESSPTNKRLTLLRIHIIN
jgi:hypothetical protein